MAHKSRRQLFRMNVREIRASSQDDVEDEYHLDGRVGLDFGKEFHEFFFVRDKTSLARVQMTLQKQSSDGRFRGPLPSGVLWYSLSSLGAYSTWEGDT